MKHFWFEAETDFVHLPAGHWSWVLSPICIWMSFWWFCHMLSHKSWHWVLMWLSCLFNMGLGMLTYFEVLVDGRQTGEGPRVLIHVLGGSLKDALWCQTLVMALTRRPATTFPMDLRNSLCTMSMSWNFLWCTTGIDQFLYFHRPAISFPSSWFYFSPQWLLLDVILGPTVLR